MLHTQDEVGEITEGLKNLVPYVSVRLYTLGGADRASILFTVSFDARETWQNGYLENSNYRRFHWLQDGTLDDFSGHSGPSAGFKIAVKFRKTKAADVSAVLSKIGKFISDVNNSRS
jgi:hypothetical protein